MDPLVCGRENAVVPDRPRDVSNQPLSVGDRRLCRAAASATLAAR